MKKEGKKVSILMVVIVILLIVAVTAVFFLKSGKGITKETVDEGCIKTEYCQLRLPMEFKGKVVTEVKDNQVEFSVFEDGSDLFTIYFGEESEVLLGTLKKENANVVLYAKFATLDKENGNYEIYCEYQEGVNTIIQNLENEYEFIKNSIIEDESVDTFDIDTDVIVLKYPKKWQEKVTVDVTETKACFSINGEMLFDVCFEDCDGTYVGEYNDIPVYVVSYNVDESKYSEAEYAMICEMQEDVNIVLENLME